MSSKADWTIAQTRDWLVDQGFAGLAAELEAEEIDGEALVVLAESPRELALFGLSKGEALKLSKRILSSGDDGLLSSTQMSPAQVRQWATEQGFEDIATKLEEQGIDEEALLALAEDSSELAELGLRKGPALKFAKRVNELREACKPETGIEDKSAPKYAENDKGVEKQAAETAVAVENATEQAELAKLKEQQRVRMGIFEAIDSSNVALLREALVAGTGFLFPAELQHGQAELQRLEKKLAREQAEEEMLEASSMEELERTIENARRLDVDAHAIAESQARLSKLRAEASKLREEEAAWAQVQDAMKSCDVQKLLDLLEKHEETLGEERCAMAKRRLPGMQVKANIRRDLEQVFRSTGDIDSIRQAVAAARQSCLPRDELAKFEERLSDLEAEVKAAKAAEAAEAAEAKAAKAAKASETVSVSDVGPVPRARQGPDEGPPEVRQLLASEEGASLTRALQSTSREEASLAVEKAQIAGVPTRHIAMLQAYLRTQAVAGYPVQV